MAKRKRRAAKKRKVEWSKVVCLLAMLAGLLIVQECLFLMYLCIKSGYVADCGHRRRRGHHHRRSERLSVPCEIRPQARRDHL